MKKTILKSILMLGLLVGFGEASQAQRVFVKIQPVAPVVARPVAPSPRHVWVDGEWVWTNHNYVWRAGYWAVPTRRHHAWVGGHWRRAYGGYNWVPGHWAR